MDEKIQETAQVAISAYQCYVYIGVALAAATIVLAAAFGISKMVCTTMEAIARQPEAGEKFRESLFLPLVLLESIAVIGSAICFLTVLLK